jgi:hypothetical protein
MEGELRRHYRQQQKQQQHCQAQQVEAVHDRRRSLDLSFSMVSIHP